MKIQVIHFDDYRQMPWKNGGGETREVLRWPLDSEVFDWRISIAEVKTSGPFSLFPGYDRALTLLSGKGMILKSQKMQYQLSQRYQPYCFSGDESIEAQLIDGPNTDFNVIWDRSKYLLEISYIENPFTIEVDDDCIIFNCQSQVTTVFTPEFKNDRCLFKIDLPILKIRLKKKSQA